MSVLEFLRKNIFSFGSVVHLNGRMVDREDGLYILQDHDPLDWDFPIRVKVDNSNIMYLIESQISFLGGGRSSLFHRCQVVGTIKQNGISDIIVNKLFMEGDSDPNEFQEIVIDDGKIKFIVAQRGNCKFNKNNSANKDWLEDL